MTQQEKDDLEMMNNLDKVADNRSSILKGGIQPRNTNRIDRRGNSITTHQKGYRISFKDNITNDKAQLADVIFVESYKKFNYDNTHTGQQGCCLIM